MKMQQPCKKEENAWDAFNSDGQPNLVLNKILCYVIQYPAVG